MLCCTANNYCDQICKRCLFSHTKFLNFETSYLSNHCIYPCNYLSFSMRKAMELGYVLTQNVTYSLTAMVFVCPRVKCGEDAPFRKSGSQLIISYVINKFILLQLAYHVCAHPFANFWIHSCYVHDYCFNSLLVAC